jgi:mono/diheme cytochrome c family protein
MRRRYAIAALLALVLGLAAAGCDRSEEATPTPETVEGTLPETEETEATETGDEGSGVEGNAEAGAEIYASAGCGSCHTLSAAGSSGTVGPNLDESQPSEELVVDRVTNGRGAMPSFSDSLDEQQIADVSAYVSESAGS